MAGSAVSVSRRRRHPPPRIQRLTAAWRPGRRPQERRGRRDEGGSAQGDTEGGKGRVRGQGGQRKSGDSHSHCSLHSPPIDLHTCTPLHSTQPLHQRYLPLLSSHRCTPRVPCSCLAREPAEASPLLPLRSLAPSPPLSRPPCPPAAVRGSCPGAPLRCPPAAATASAAPSTPLFSPCEETSLPPSPLLPPPLPPSQLTQRRSHQWSSGPEHCSGCSCSASVLAEGMCGAGVS